MKRRRPLLVSSAVALSFAACGGSDAPASPGAAVDAGAVDTGAPGSEAGAGPTGPGSPGADGGAGNDGGDSTPVPVPTLPESLACHPPLGPSSTSHPTTVVGNGTSQGCTEAELAAAVATGGVITFACGGPTTIMLTAPLKPPRGKDTVIDGGTTITLDGGGKTRLVSFNGGGYRTGTSTLTLQNLTFQNGHATGTRLPAAPAPCSQGVDTDGGGGAVYVVDGLLTVVNCTFTGNTGNSPGPDVAGGAIYVNGSKGTTIVGSRFAGNHCSNGGAVGALNSDLAIYTSTLSGNEATGTGQNGTSAACTSKSTETGDGGSGGAIYMDGGQDGTTTLCGVVLTKNHANALGGAFFRVYDGAKHDVNVDASTVSGNVADGPVGTDGNGPGGGAFYLHNANLNLRNSTVSNNASPGCGALQADATTLALTNVTLSGNVATRGSGGAVCLFSTGGTLTNCTLAGNQALGGSSFSDFYGAALFAGGLTLNNCLLANNTTANSQGRMQCAGGAPGEGARNLQWPRDKVAGGGADSPCVTGITFADPQLGALQDNGGPTQTMATAADPAIVQVGTGCPAFDQTGKTRATTCTLGALER